ncbi:radical sam [Lucifera butyrica]|uniref:Radical sam n=1 Tax=Lucifera butyrica TaxID=1351585 RepID=A0A498RDU5_9FIRM|nr:SPASM domain-containing protein [Lucifera butyrica]VBB08302.1 radical sam [Lucifera butyrica]
MEYVSVLVKPMSSQCNLRCRYCFYEDISIHREVPSFGRMSHGTAEKMLENIYRSLSDGDDLTLAFQGGEPMLAGLEYFKDIVSFVEAQDKDVTVHYTLQTNGILLDDSWCEFLKQHGFLLGLSLDGCESLHDRYRVDAEGLGTFPRVLAVKRLLDAYRIEYNVLCVLTAALAQEPDDVYTFLRQEQIGYVQFIPCLAGLSGGKREAYVLTPELFAGFYRRIYDLWFSGLVQGTYMSIRLFDGILNLFAAGRITACGMLGSCRIQYVVEADGSVYPCDFYAIDRYRMGNICEMGLQELFQSSAAQEFLRCRTKPPAYCASCPFGRMCRGGCRRMAEAMYVNEQNDFCGYQAVLQYVLPHIDEVAMRLKKVS